ncbi:MAG: SDR family NAD(P)-dependent oxidoreductase [Oscillospiraceae bacterium]|nr:SDR family NAD(P)-dependent oxidoreductase [Oscillospiraceae bacterium]
MNSAVKKYWSKYKWTNIQAMIKNMKRSPEKNSEPFRDQFVVMTGATSGIGYHTARKYASMGAHILMINRNPEKSAAVSKEIADEFHVPVEYIIADLTLLADIQRVGQHLLSIEKPINVLIHNAGLHLESRKENPSGLEVNFVIHYLCPLIINKMLIPKYQRDKTGRILLVNSEAYRFAAWGLDLEDLEWKKRRYSGNKAYGAGKLAQLLSMHNLSGELAPYNVTINAMHPGMVRTDSGKDNGKGYQWYKRNFIDKRSPAPDISAEALYYLGTKPELSQTTDAFFHLTTEEELAPPALDLEAAKALLINTADLLSEKGIVL